MGQNKKGSERIRPDWKSLKRGLSLYRYIRPYRGTFALGMLFLFMSSGASLAFPKFLGELVNAPSSENFLDKVQEIALLLFGLLLFQAFSSYFRVILFVRVAEKALAALRQATYDKLLRLPMAFYGGRRVGELNSRISSDITQLQETFTITLAEFIRQLIIIVGGITLLMYTSVQLTLFMLAILPLIVIAAVLFGRFIRKYSKRVQAEVADSNTIVEETLQGMATVKAFANEHYEWTRYREKTNEVARTAIKGGHYRAAFSSFIILGLFGAVVAVIWKGSLLIGQGAINSGELFSFVLYSSFIGGSIGGMADVYAKIQKAIGSTEELLDLFEEEEESLRIEYNDRPERPLEGALRFEGVHFSYPGRKEMEVIKGIDLHVEAGETVALVGSSGSGKTTLTNLLLGFYPVDSGRILVDEKEIGAYDLSEYRKHLAIVPQDVLLFGGTIAENIRYGRTDASLEEVKAAAEKAFARGFIEEFPDGFDTVVGERGVQLSGGQRQRVAIARAFLKDPSILILDEATSALDSHSEAEVQKALEELMSGRTSLTIAHRLSTVRHADRIIVLEEGQLVESGPPDELIQRPSGRFRALLEMQQR
ncbi:MAG: Lipid A export ATP-binding/permease protein MsbA [Flavobacteriia bacterium]|nr:MAG: Lipid A export ATP-binding/permease protein MsbA [Flavobacteriia bacterium]